MNYKISKTLILKRILLVFTIGVFCMFLFYKFMTYDRTYIWSKEYQYNIEEVLRNTDFKIDKVESIDNKEIKLPSEKNIKIKIQKFLSNYNLMNYSFEHGEKISLKSSNSDQIINCKGWCLGDHLIGLEIEYKNLNPQQLAELKSKFEKEFSYYEIVWTELM